MYEHLRQIPNTPFYVTPDEPADPRDCSRYPDSPYCGGNPFSLRPVAIRPQIVNDGCAKGIKITPVLGFVKLPPVEVIAIEPRCRLPKPPAKYEPPDEDVPPTPPPTSNQCRGPNGGTYSWVTNGDEIVYTGAGYTVIPQGTRAEESAQIKKAGLIISATDAVSAMNDGITGRELKVFVEQLPPAVYPGLYVLGGDLPENTSNLPTDPTCQIGIVWVVGEANMCHFLNGDYPGCNEGPQWVYQGTNDVTVFGQHGNYLINISSPCDNDAPPPPPPPPPKRKCDCMGCCPPSPTQDKNDRDLEEIKRLLQKLLKLVGEPQKVTLFDADPNKPGRQKVTKKEETLFNAIKLATQRAEVVAQIVGIEAFPVDVPATVIAPEKSGIWGEIFAFIDGKKRRKLKSLVEMIAWQSEQDAAVLGKWHQSIDIEDGDALKEGEQPQKIVLPNIAETMKEQILLLSNLIQAQGLTLDIALKSLHESSSTKLDVARTLLAVKDIQEYLDYDTVQKSFDVPIQISVPNPEDTDVDRANLSKYLEPSETKVVSDEWLGRDSFQEALTDLRNAAAMIRASLSNRV